MGIKLAVKGFIDGLRGGQTKGEMIPVVNAMTTPPTQADIPRSWSSAYMGPGAPISGMLSSARDKDASTEPRTFQYPANVNATMSPRAAYGLMPFADLRQYAESVPEVAMCIRIITEELKSFEPRILDRSGNECKDPALTWMVKNPDLFNPWPVWLSRFIYNVLVYDAPAVYRPRDSRGHIMAMRVIDGSTLFALVDERGEQPAPPAPAFSQVIYGVPRAYLNTYQLWYRPRHLRADAPYGRSPIEDCLPAVRLLANMWSYEEAWYTEGTTAEQVLTAPANWTPDQILEFERTYNARMAGNTAERAGRIRFVPNGTESLALKDATFKKDTYDAAANTVRMTFGIPRTEFGESPGSGLGGSGFLEAMQSLFFRLSLAPVKSFVESLFNETIEENGYDGYSLELAFPRESLDPKKEEDKAINRFVQGVTTRDETRGAVGMKPRGGEVGNFMVNPGGGDAGGLPGSRFGQLDPNGMIPVSRKIPIKGFKIPVSAGSIPVVDGEEDGTIPVRKLAGVDPEDDAYFGSPVRLQDGVAIIGGERLPEQQAVWMPGADPIDEAVYLIDRALAPTDRRYLVPVTYQADVEGQIGQVRIPDMGTKSVMPSRYGDDWMEQAAVLDYITGTQRIDEWRTHPSDPKRPILVPTGTSFGDPDSEFVRACSGRDLSAEILQSIAQVAGDEVLWHDVSECAGYEAARDAQNRAVLLNATGRMP